MKLEQQVTSLEISKKLKELGVNQESLFWWRHFLGMPTSTGVQEADYWVIQDGAYRTGDISAFTIAELGELLPREIEYKTSSKEKSGYDGYRSMNLTVGKTVIDNGWYVMYNDPHPANKVPIYTQHADTEADSRGKMLIYLLENNLVSPTQ